MFYSSLNICKFIDSLAFIFFWQDGRVNALYSTPSIYVDAKHATNESWPLKTDDYFPWALAWYSFPPGLSWIFYGVYLTSLTNFRYADGGNSYWTGFFTSRPALKRYIRMLSGYYLVSLLSFFLLVPWFHITKSTSKGTWM